MRSIKFTLSLRSLCLGLGLFILASPAVRAEAPYDSIELPESFLASRFKSVEKDFREGRCRQILEVLKSETKLPELPPTYDRLLLVAGLCHAKQGNHKRAIDLFERSLAVRGSNSDTLYFLALSALENKDTVRAIRTLEEGVWFSRVQLVPPSAVLDRLLTLYLQHDLRNQALALLEQAQGTTIDDSRPRVTLAEALEADGEPARALGLLRAGLAKHPEAPSPVLALATAEHLLRNADRKFDRKAMREVVSLANRASSSEEAPDELAVRGHAAEVRGLLALQDYEQAEKKLLEAEKRYPQEALIHQVRAQYRVERAAGSASSE